MHIFNQMLIHELYNQLSQGSTLVFGDPFCRNLHAGDIITVYEIDENKEKTGQYAYCTVDSVVLDYSNKIYSITFKDVIKTHIPDSSEMEAIIKYYDSLM